MDKSLKCECGENTFWWFGEYVRCPNCFNEMKVDKSGQWLRRFNKEENKYSAHWEKFKQI